MTLRVVPVWYENTKSIILHGNVQTTTDHTAPPTADERERSPTANFGPLQESRSYIPQSNEDACRACATVKSDLRMLEKQFNEFRNLVLTKINMEIGVSTPKGIDLQKENNNLRKDLKMLRSQLEAKNALLTEANTKIKNLENERDSLITALKLVSDDHANAAPHHQLTPNDCSDQSTPPSEQPIVSNGWTENRRRNSRNDHNQESRRKSTIILGDSMIKHVNTRRMQSNGNVYKKCFPGCSSEDMKHYMIPALSRKPDHCFLDRSVNGIK